MYDISLRNRQLDGDMNGLEMEGVMMITTMQDVTMMEEIAVVIMSSRFTANLVNVWIQVTITILMATMMEWEISY